MLKLPLPCPEHLWLAETAKDWRTEATRIQTTSRGNPPYGLQAWLQELLSNKGDLLYNLMPSMDDSQPSPFAMNILIYALTSEVLEISNSVPSTYSKAIRRLKIEELGAALASWRDRFMRMDPTSQASEMARSALIAFHFASILLDVDLGSILGAGGGIHTGGTVTSSANNESFDFLANSELASKEMRIHSLEIIGLCPDDQMPLKRSLSRPYTAFIAVNILWAHVVVLQHQSANKQNDHKKANIGFSSDAQTMRDIISRRSSASSQPQELNGMKRDARDLMQRVRGRLLENPGEIDALSYVVIYDETNSFIALEACKILDILL